jgi:hypothetical protein
MHGGRIYLLQVTPFSGNMGLIWNGLSVEVRGSRRCEDMGAGLLGREAVWTSPEDGGSVFVQNVGTNPELHTTSQPKSTRMDCVLYT